MPLTLPTYRRSPVQCAVIYNAGPYLKLLPAYTSGFWLLITLLTLSSGPAYGEWVAIGSTDDGMTAYANPDTIRRKEDTVKIWVIFDFKTTQTLTGHLILSSKGEEEYDCNVKRRRVLTSSGFSGNMGGGKVVWRNSDETKWEPVVPESIGQTLWEFTCGKK